MENVEILTDIPTEDNDSEDGGCCGDGICECLCCSHIFTFQSFEMLSIAHLQFIVKTNMPYVQIYSDQFASAPWQPPRLV